MRPDRQLDWHRISAGGRTAPAVVDPRRRLRIVGFGLLGLVLAVFARLVQLEATQGAAFRDQACQPVLRRQDLDGVRGRLLAQSGTVLAHDRKVLALAVHYRYLEEPPDPAWLRAAARPRLPKAERKDPQRLAEEEARLRAERADLAVRLAPLCGLSSDEWTRRTRQIQDRVQAIAENVNRRRRTDAERREASAAEEAAADAAGGSFAGWLAGACRDLLRQSMEESPPERITVSEELDYHVIAEDVPLAVAAEVESSPERYPGVKIVERRRRTYPAGPMAAHLLGGLERQYESLLRGRRGTLVEKTDRSGRILECERAVEPGIGRDLVLTLDARLQATVESLLDGALARRALVGPPAGPAGGAIVLLDVRSGAILAAASAPRFDPNGSAGADGTQVAALLADPGHPLFDRVTRMAIPPGSVFKIVSAAALVEAAAIDPHEPLFCQGYLRAPDQQRCAIYRRHGIGHDEVALADALAQSCNVYFFHHAGRLGLRGLVDWASRFGFGRVTGVDLPGESAGTLPALADDGSGAARARGVAEAQLLSIGQGRLEVTPLQVARMMAAVANGGLLVTPHVVCGLGLTEHGEPAPEASAENADPPVRIPPPQPIPGLHPATLAAIREGLKRVVSDPRGTAHATVFLDSIEIAGKTGTAETGADGAEHAWFAGYAPAAHPQVAFAVALEHAGDAAETAGPVAKRLVLRLQELGYFGGK